MNNEHHNLIAFLATLVAILAIAGLSRFGHVDENTGRILDTIAVGLIGVIGTFRPRTSQAEKPAA